MQAQHTTNGSTFSAGMRLFRDGGFSRMWRGVQTMFSGCAPAHAAYFSTYEGVKQILGANGTEHKPIAAGTAGASATIVHDLIMTPMDVCKQRLQLGYYTGMIDCFQNIIRHEGFRALYLSFPVTLFMNIPFASVMVATNESMKRFLNPQREYNLWSYVFSAACAGAVAAAVTNPLDVVKTRLQTQSLIDSNRHPPRQNSPQNASCRPHVTATIHQSHAEGHIQSTSTSSGDTQEKRVKMASTKAHKSFPQTTLTNLYQHKSLNVKGVLSPQAAVHTNSPLRVYSGILDAVKQIYSEEGYRGFLRGIRPRLIVSAPSVAVSWTAYETIKHFLVQMETSE